MISYNFLQDLEPFALDTFKKNSTEISLKKGNFLFFQGEICNDILFLEKGSVRLYLQGEGVDEITLYKISKGEQCVINTSSVISQTPAVATAVCHEDLQGFLINKDIVRDLMLQSSSYQNYIFNLFSVRLVSLAQLIEDIKFKRLDLRVKEWLSSQKSQEIKITHEELAQTLGSTRVVISRILKSLEKQGLILQLRGSIKIIH